MDDLTPTQNLSNLESENLINEEVDASTPLIEEEGATSKYAPHGEKVMAVAKKGEMAGKDAIHYKCKYCSNLLIGPGSGSFLAHVRRAHPKKCPELIQTKSKPIPEYFSKAKMKDIFDQDIAVGKLIIWIVKTDQSFTIVDNDHFNDYVNYLKSDHNTFSRRTIMRRLKEIYNQKKKEMKSRLNSKVLNNLRCLYFEKSTVFLWFYYLLY